MRRLVVPLVIGIVAFVASAATHASVVFTSILTNAQENPPAVPTLVGGGARTPSFGNATLILNDAQTALTLFATVFNIDFTGSQTADPNDNLTVAHIHGGPAVTPTTNGPVVWGFIGTPFNDNNPNDVVVTPFASGVGGTVSAKWDAPEGNNTTLALQLANLFAGRTYLNFHTTQFPGGEIRGAINVVPEPGMLALMTILLAGLGMRTRRGRGIHA
jgi:hypothetical protein